MAQARRKSSKRGVLKRGWVLLLLGIGIGVAGVMLTQMLGHRSDGRSGIGNLFSRLGKSVEKPIIKKEPEPAQPPKPKFDFYTILPETETVLPDRRVTVKDKLPKTKSEEGVTYVLQAASFAGFEEADQLKAKLALAGVVAHIQKISIEGRGEYHRVRLGPYQKIEQLDAAAAQLQKLGVKAIRLKVKKGEVG